MPRHVRKGDTVMVTSGSFRGAVGQIVRMLTKQDRVVIQFPASVYDGENRKQRVKSMKPSRLNPQGARVALDRSFHISNVSPVADGKPTRVRFAIKADGSKIRVAARGGSELGVVHGPRSRTTPASKPKAPKAGKPAKAERPAPRTPAKPAAKSVKSASGAKRSSARRSAGKSEA